MLGPTSSLEKVKGCVVLVNSLSVEKLVAGGTFDKSIGLAKVKSRQNNINRGCLLENDFLSGSVGTRIKCTLEENFINMCDNLEVRKKQAKKIKFKSIFEVSGLLKAKSKRPKS